MSQGSILRPLFFVLVMDEFSDTSKLHFRFLFADDKSIGNRIFRINRNSKSRNKCSYNIVKCKQNDCKNEKTQSMLFHKLKIKIIVKT